VAPPSIVINTSYPGASAQTLEDSVISVIEREMNGSPGLIYMESVSQADGTGSITLSFEAGTNPTWPRWTCRTGSRATPRLPAAVTQQGVRVDKSRSNFLLFIMLSSENGAYDPIALGDYASRNVMPEIQRMPGVGQAQLFGTERAMRIWIDPAKLRATTCRRPTSRPSRRRTPRCPRAHRRPAQHHRPGHCRHGGGQGPAGHGRAVRPHRAARQRRRLHRAPEGRGPHRARAQSYATSARLNGKPATGIGVQLTPGNALATARR
jgi:multidrug efflux pump